MLQDKDRNGNNVPREDSSLSQEVTAVGAQSTKEYLFLLWKQYKTADKKLKSDILSELVRNLGIHRKSAVRLMRCNYPPKSLQGNKGGSRKRYSKESKEHLEILWKSMGYIAADRMKPALAEWLEYYEGPGFNESIKDELLMMSISTIKRFLAKARAALRKRQNTATRRGIKKFIAVVPIRDLGHVPTEVGHCEVDCVAHCGGSLSGQFAWTVNLTDIHTGWTECEAIYGKDGFQVKKALKLMEKRLPFKLRALYFDNGSEFMNDQIIRKFAKEGRKIDLPIYRGRPYKKNDQCYVEQKNYTHVRQLFGYGRMDWEPGIKMMNDIYRKEWRRLQNFYLPQQKLEEKVRVGSKIRRRMGEAKTPYSRLLSSLDVKKSRDLEREKAKTNPFQLRNNQRAKLRKLNAYVKDDMPQEQWGKMAL